MYRKGGTEMTDMRLIEIKREEKEKDWALWLDCGRECKTGNEIKRIER